MKTIYLLWSSRILHTITSLFSHIWWYHLHICTWDDQDEQQNDTPIHISPDDILIYDDRHRDHPLVAQMRTYMYEYPRKSCTLLTTQMFFTELTKTFSLTDDKAQADISLCTKDASSRHLTPTLSSKEREHIYGLIRRIIDGKEPRREELVGVYKMHIS